MTVKINSLVKIQAPKAAGDSHWNGYVGYVLALETVREDDNEYVEALVKCGHLETRVMLKHLTPQGLTPAQIARNAWDEKFGTD